MGIQLSSDFSPRIKRLMDDRTSVKTLDELKALDDNIIPPGLIVFCEEDGVSYRRTLASPTGDGNDFGLLWMALGSGGKIEQTIQSNVQCGAISSGMEVPVNTPITTFASMLLFDDRDPEISCEFNCPLVNDIILSGNKILNPILTASIDDFGGVTQFSKITYKDNVGNILRQVDIAQGASPAINDLTCATTLTISPSSGTYKFEIVADYDLTRTQGKSSVYTYIIEHVWPTFFGTANVVPTTAAEIKALGGKELYTKGTDNHTNDITCNKMYDVIAVPQVLGNIVKIKDQNGFDITETYNVSTITLSTDDGLLTQDYNVYCTKELQILNNYTKVFWFVNPN